MCRFAINNLMEKHNHVIALFYGHTQTAGRPEDSGLGTLKAALLFLYGKHKCYVKPRASAGSAAGCRQTQRRKVHFVMT